MNVSHCLSSLWPGFPRGCGGIFQGILPWMITLYQPLLSQTAENGSISLYGATQPVDIEEEGRSPTIDRQQLK